MGDMADSQLDDMMRLNEDWARRITERRKRLPRREGKVKTAGAKEKQKVKWGGLETLLAEVAEEVRSDAVCETYDCCLADKHTAADKLLEKVKKAQTELKQLRAIAGERLLDQAVEDSGE